MSIRVIEAYNIQSFHPGDKSHVRSNRNKFHYTAPEGLLSIIKYQTLYFTDIRYFNDKSENTYIYQCFKKFLKKHPRKYKVLREMMGTIFPQTENPDVYASEPYFPFSDKGKRVFVFCTCTDPDSLSMWNYYVKNGNYIGYSIGLNPTQIVKSFEGKPDEMEILLGNVIYNEEDQFKEIKLIADSLERSFAGEENKSKGLALFYTYVQKFSAFFKNGKFSHEKEFRFVISVDEDKLCSCLDDKLKLDFRNNNGIIVPYLKLSFNKNALKTINLSPNMEEKISRESIIEFCKHEKYGKIQIYASKIPIRF